MSRFQVLYLMKPFNPVKIEGGRPEEIAYRNGYISEEKLLELSNPMQKNNYGKYLRDLVLKPESVNGNL